MIRLTGETKEQADYIYWLNSNYPKIKTIISPIVKFGSVKQRIFHGAIMKAMGYTPGTLDIFIPEPRGGYYGLFIEMKDFKGKKSPKQNEMIDYLTGNGYMTATCRGCFEAIDITKKYLEV